MTDSRGAVLAWDGDADHHEPDVVALADEVIRTGRQQVLSHNSIQCDRVDCEIRGIVVQPLEIEGSIVGTLAALTNQTAGPVLLRATGEVARYVSSQLELAELDESRARLNRAEVRALRAQISPHFVYNALTTIASFIRTDPVRARELLIEFADFTRYSFRTAGEYTTLKDELNNIERYIRLEKARFGDRLNIKLEIAPEVLSVVLPFLALQPLVENAVRHGLSGKPNGGTITITAENAGAECVIIVEDDGVGMDPRAADRRPRGRAPVRRARRAGQRRRPDALGVRRRLRPGGRHERRRGHEDHAAGAEVPGGHPGLRGGDGAVRRPPRSVAAWTRFAFPSGSPPASPDVCPVVSATTATRWSRWSGCTA